MPCSWTNPVGCAGTAVGGAAGYVADKGVQALADAIKGGVGSMVKALMTWWVTSPSVFTADFGPVESLQRLLLPVTLVVATAALIWQGILMMVQRKSDPMLDAGRGLLALGFYSGAGVAALVGAMKAGDGLAQFLVGASTGGGFDARMAKLFSFTAVEPGLVIVLGILIVVASFVQWVMLFFRQGAIVILAAFMPLAAAGSIGHGTRPWLRRLLAWICSLIAYKPMVAFCYAVAFHFIGTSTDLTGVILGFVVLIFSVVALPAMLRFFSWGIDAAAEHMGSGAMGALAAGAGLASAGMQIANGFGGSGRVSAAQQAAMIDASLGPAGGPTGGGRSGGPTGATNAPAGGGNGPAGGAGGAGAGRPGTAGTASGSGAVGSTGSAGSPGAAAGSSGGGTVGGAGASGAAAAGAAGAATKAAVDIARGSAAAAGGALTGGAPASQAAPPTGAAGSSTARAAGPGGNGNGNSNGNGNGNGGRRS